MARGGRGVRHRPGWPLLPGALACSWSPEPPFLPQNLWVGQRVMFSCLQIAQQTPHPDVAAGPDTSWGAGSTGQVHRNPIQTMAWGCPWAVLSLSSPPLPAAASGASLKPPFQLFSCFPPCFRTSWLLLHHFWSQRDLNSASSVNAITLPFIFVVINAHQDQA